jgi:uncharacterized membrane protein
MIWTALILVAALGSALVAGVFYAFSGFVMPALARLPAAQGIAAMQAINITAVMPGFMIGFIGSALLCIAVLAAAFFGRAGGWAVAGALLYLIGTLGVTILANVPRNNLLAALDPAAGEAAAAWARYQSGWNLWNHVRGLAGLAGAAALIVSLL